MASIALSPTKPESTGIQVFAMSHQEIKEIEQSVADTTSNIGIISSQDADGGASTERNLTTPRRSPRDLTVLGLAVRQGAVPLPCPAPCDECPAALSLNRSEATDKSEASAQERRSGRLGEPESPLPSDWPSVGSPMPSVEKSERSRPSVKNVDEHGLRRARTDNLEPRKRKSMFSKKSLRRLASDHAVTRKSTGTIDMSFFRRSESKGSGSSAHTPLSADEVAKIKWRSKSSSARSLTMPASYGSVGTLGPAAILGSPPATTVLDRWHYTMDRVLSNRSGFFVAMAFYGMVQVVVFGFIYSFFWMYEGPDGESGTCDDPRPLRTVTPFVEGIWEAWTFMADAGTHAKVFHTSQRIVAASIAIAGILFWSTIMALTVDAIRDKMDTLRKGRSKIVETNHTVILGWTEKTAHVIQEICNANESEGGGVIAVMAPYAKDQMESELMLAIPLRQRLGTRIIFRSGSPLVVGDLAKVSAHSARAIVLLATSADADRADADTIRTLLALRATLKEVLGCHVVAEVRDIDNEPLVKLVGGSAVETLVSHDMIGRLMLMAVRQPGLAKVYEAMLGFEGSEFYMEEWPVLYGLQFGDMVERLPDAIAIGISCEDGTIQLSPPPEREIKPGDKIIVIAEDNDSYKPMEPELLDCGDPPEKKPEKKKVEKILFCGWRRDIRDIFEQLDRIVKCGTEVHMMTHSVTLADRNKRLLEDGFCVEDLKNVQLVHHYGNTSVRRKLESLPIEDFSSCMIFADQDFETDTMHADSHSLATLLLIRDIQARRKNERRRDRDKQKKSQ